MDPRRDYRRLFSDAIVWDSHACLPLRPRDETFLPQLLRHKQAGATVVSLNVYFDALPTAVALAMIATFRDWIRRHSSEFILAKSASDIQEAKRAGTLAITFDIEGGRVVADQPGLVEVFYALGVRWMLLAYNRNNALGGGCQDEDSGLTQRGRQVIREMEAAGMVLCCSHTGYRTARDAIEWSSNPVIFSHSNPRRLVDHPRNIPDDLIVACADSGGVVNLSGVSAFLGASDDGVDRLLEHIDYTCQLVGPRHVGLGLDYVFDPEELNELFVQRPDLYPRESYSGGLRFIPPERLEQICRGLVRRGYSDSEVGWILGENNLRVAQAVWR